MKKLRQQLSSSYIEAMNKLAGKKARKRIVAYVESYEDIFFWSNLLRPLETKDCYFEVMLPSQTTLCKGKKIALSNELGERLGRCMIACVDADYDYLIQGATSTSAVMCNNPFVFHTYVYAIENFQCYAPALHNVCVMATLNDRRLFDFESFLRHYSEVVWPLFVWNVWCYSYGTYKQFSMLDFYHIVRITQINYHHPEQTLNRLRHQVNTKISRLQHQFPEGKKTYKPLCNRLKALGLTPQTTYLYMRGHDVFDGIVVPMLDGVCELLRRERERDIHNLAEHQVQMQNELSAYQHATAPIDEMLRKHTAYMDCPQYLQVQEDVRRLVDSFASPVAEETASLGASQTAEKGMSLQLG